MKYKKLTIDDKNLFDNFLKPYLFYSSEYSFTNLFIWKEGLNVEYALLNKYIIVKKTDFDGSSHFMQPIGYEKGNYNELNDIIDLLINEKNNLCMNYLFKDAEKWFIDDLKHLNRNFIIEEDRDNFDYIYESEKLINLSGKKYHGKKNHFNSFIKINSYDIKEINKDNKSVVNDCINNAEIWYKNNIDKGEYLLYELNGIKDMLNNIGRLDYTGIAVYIKDKVCAFSLGEKLSENMAVIHIEKADSNIKGLYAFINRMFAKKFSDLKYINREQDLGIPSLRKSKLSYYPYDFIKKYIVL